MIKWGFWRRRVDSDEISLGGPWFGPEAGRRRRHGRTQRFEGRSSSPSQRRVGYSLCLHDPACGLTQRSESAAYDSWIRGHDSATRIRLRTARAPDRAVHGPNHGDIRCNHRVTDSDSSIDCARSWAGAGKGETPVSNQSVSAGCSVAAVTDSAARPLGPWRGGCYSECDCIATVVRFRVPWPSAGAIPGLALHHSPGRCGSQGAVPVFGPSCLGLLYWLPCRRSRGKTRIARAGPWRRVKGSASAGSALPAAVPRGRGPRPLAAAGEPPDSGRADA